VAHPQKNVLPKTANNILRNAGLKQKKEGDVK